VTGLIYVILIALWAMVLVPRFLRRHDERPRRRDDDRIKQTLAPNAAVADGEQRAESWTAYLLSLTNLDASAWIGQVRGSGDRQARKRRNVVLALGGTTVVSVLGAMAGVIPGFIAVLAAILLCGYVAAMFSVMRRSESARAGAAQRGQQARPSAMPQTSRSAAAATDGVRVVEPQAQPAGSWEPVATTLPTYVNKPKASRLPRRIDLTGEGWTGAGMVEEARRQSHPDQFDREFAAVEPTEEQQVAEYAYPDTEDPRYYRRAVNE
jgi:hypothetical protein